MATKINLLPVDLSASSGVAKLAGIVQKTAYAMTAVFLIFGIGVGGYLLILGSQIQNSQRTKEQAATSIKSLETTEQSLLLVKDRIKKADSILVERTTEEKVDSLEKLISLIPPSVILSEAQIEKSKTELSFIAQTSGGLTSFLGTLVSVDIYKNIELKNFGFTPAAGYLITLEVN